MSADDVPATGEVGEAATSLWAASGAPAATSKGAPVMSGAAPEEGFPAWQPSDDPQEVLEEATAALPIGFLSAGARSVVASLWNVNDASTAELMAAFYRRMAPGGTLQGHDRLTALRDAKRELRARLGAYHWAPFLYFGVPD